MLQAMMLENINQNLAIQSNMIRNPAEQPKSNNNTTRQRRSVMDFVAGSFVTNVISTVLDRIWPNQATQDLQERENITEKRIIELNARTTFQDLQHQAMEEHLQITTQLVKLNVLKIQHIMSTFPILNIVGSNVIARIHIMGSLIDRTSISFSMQRPDLISLYMLFKFEPLKQIDPNSIEPESVNFSSIGSNMFLTEFTARLKSTTAALYHVATFKYWDRLLTDKPVMKEYIGSNYVLHDAKYNCSLGLQERPQSYAHAECSMQNYIDKRLSKWRDIENIEEPETQIIPAYP